MNKRFLPVCIASIFITLYLNQADAQVIQSQAVIGGNASDFLSTTCKTADNGFLAVGYSNSDSSAWKSQSSNGLFALWVVKFKVAQSGENRFQWEKTFTRSNQNVYVTNAISCSDGGFLISSRISNVAANDDAWLVKLDAEGDIQWDRIFSTQYSDEIIALSETSDKGFILGASFAFIKIDSAGVTQWQNQPADFYINGAYLNAVFELKNSNRRSYIAGGGVTRAQGDSVEKGELLARTDSLCNPLRQMVYPPDDSMNVIYYLNMDVTPTNDGTLIHGLVKENGASSYYTADVVKVDNRGNFKWRYINRSLFDQNGTPHPVIAIPTSDGGYIYGGSIHTSEILPSDFMIEKLDQDGKLVWSKLIRANQNDLLTGIKEIKKGLYLISGNSESTIGLDKTKKNFGETDYWFLTLEDTTTNSLPAANSIAASKLNIGKFKVYPNPAKNKLHIQTEGSHIISFINQDGKTVVQTNVKGSKDITISGLPGGLYYLKDQKTGFTQKLLITK